VFDALRLDRIVGGGKRSRELYTLFDDPSAYWIWVGIYTGFCVTFLFMTFLAWEYRHVSLDSIRQKTRGN
jgi:hypothetical protein